jgi:uncharacterized lipoprotein YajG
VKSLTVAVALTGSVLLSGCLAKTAMDVVTLPVKAASRGVDAVTTSQSEADEKRGREIRKREEKLGKLARERDKANRQCQRGDRDACDEVQDITEEMDDLQYRPYR